MKKLLLALPALAVIWAWFFIATSWIDAACLDGDPNCSEDVTVQVTIEAGDICIGATGTFDFGTFTASSNPQTVTGAFLDDFWVEDLRGDDDWYYTTLQLSGDLVSGSNSIPAANVSVKTDDTGAAWVTTIAWTANTRVVIDAGMASFQSLDSARTFIKRDADPNFGIVGMYGTMPELEVIIPAYTPVGTYSATLVYTLYEN